MRTAAAAGLHMKARSAHAVRIATALVLSILIISKLQLTKRPQLIALETAPFIESKKPPADFLARFQFTLPSCEIPSPKGNTLHRFGLFNGQHFGRNQMERAHKSDMAEVERFSRNNVRPAQFKRPLHAAKAIVQTCSYLAMLGDRERSCRDIQVFKFCAYVFGNAVLKPTSEHQAGLTIGG